MVAINEPKGIPEPQSLEFEDPEETDITQPGLADMFFGDVTCPYCKKIYFTTIFYDDARGRKICKKCKRIYEITRPVAVACNRKNRSIGNKN